MKSQITANFLTLTQDACQKSFWRKPALRIFLKRIGISNSFLSTWAEDETKRVLLDRLFEKLPQSDKGRAAILRMAHELSEQKTFPDLQGWEDTKDKIEAALEAVKHLRNYIDTQTKYISDEENKVKRREESQQQRLKNIQSRASLSNLEDKLKKLVQGTQTGGYAFQDWFYELVNFYEIVHRKPYYAEGRQIDGSITHDGTTYLVELKFGKNQTEATDIDSLLSKVKSKADNTMGIFVSMSGFSSVAIDTASVSQTPLLLFDYTHIYAVLGGTIELPDLIARIRRHASQTGKAFLPVKDF